MFTGIVEGTGAIKGIDRIGSGLKLTILPLFEASDIRIGDSVSVDGVCLTITKIKGNEFEVDVSSETISRSTVGLLSQGDKVNLERALRVSDRLGGHLVSGHIDGTGKILKKVPSERSYLLEIEVDEKMSRYMVEKGSVAVDGISLTINRCERNSFEVNIIPQTAKETTLLEKNPGDPVNIETDMVGKYVEKFLNLSRGSREQKESGIDRDFLLKHGFKGAGE